MQCKIAEKYFKALEALAQDEKESRSYGCGGPLFHSEINFLEIIRRYPDSTSTVLAEKLAVTKGAITQWGNKLEGKGLVRRYIREDNKKEKHYQLTPLGEDACKGHQAYHKQANEELCRYISSLTEKEKAILIGFLDQLSILPISGFSCPAPCCSE